MTDLPITWKFAFTLLGVFAAGWALTAYALDRILARSGR